MFVDYNPKDLAVARLGECAVPSPLRNILFTSDDEGVACAATRTDIQRQLEAPDTMPFFEMAGPREKIFFSPKDITCAIVTCGGLCPGLNDVIRGITLHLSEGYGVKNILGLRYGYRGLVEQYGYEPLRLTGESVSEIHRRGGTVLKSSRGRQDTAEMLRFVQKRKIDILFTIGGDGTQRAAAEMSQAIQAKGLPFSVVGIPKTIDNDIPVIQQTFGFETAVEESVRVIRGGHVEAHDYPEGVCVIRLMGRNSGFIAAAASIASGDVNFCLVPEVPFALDGPSGLYHHLEQRLRRRGHAVIVVAEGAGKELREQHGAGDIGILLRDRIKAEFVRRGSPVTLKYIDPSYIIRSVPATADDSVFCTRLAHNAVHAAMSGRTEMVIGYYNNFFVHIPFSLLGRKQKRVDPEGKLWRAVLETTGQPARMA